jgi:hypothetical protein
MNSKVCFKCGEQKDLSAFYRHPEMADGHLNKCKECNKADVRNNRSKNIEYYKEYDRNRANLDNRVLARNEYAKTKNGVLATRRARNGWGQRNPIKKYAHALVRSMVVNGLINKPTCCCACGNIANLHGHHDDYAKPLDVRWLCPKCHRDWHKIHGEAANG